MDKKPLHLGLHSGLPPFVSEEADREQLKQMPKASEPSLVTLMVQRSKAPSASPVRRPPPSEADRAKMKAAVAVFDKAIRARSKK